MARSSSSARQLNDHDEIRQWAEERGGKPACVRGTGGGDDVGMIRLDFPGYSGADSLEEISWDEWFQKFDESGLALLFQQTTADGQQSNFNKLIARETANARARGDNKASRRKLSGRTSAGRSSGTRRSSAGSGSSRKRGTTSRRRTTASSRGTSTRSAATLSPSTRGKTSGRSRETSTAQNTPPRNPP